MTRHAVPAILRAHAEPIRRRGVWRRFPSLGHLRATKRPDARTTGAFASGVRQPRVSTLDRCPLIFASTNVAG